MKTFTNLFNSTKTLTLLLTLLLGVGNVWGTETVFYTNDCPKSSNSAYATYYDVTVNNIKWKAPGNQYAAGDWRLGGKSKNALSIYMYTQDVISANITKIEVTHGTKTAGDVGNVQLDVYSTAALAAAGATGDISSISVAYVDNSTLTFTRPNAKSWAGRYYRFSYSINPNNTSSNKYVQLVSIKFYYDAGSSKTATTTTFGAEVDNKTFDAEVGGTFETKTATVSASGTSVTEPAVTYASSKPAVATVNENTGAVTIVAKGTTDITASYAGNDTYDASSAKYTINVTNPNEVSVWSEDWSGDNPTTGYTLNNGGGTTSIKSEKLAGGETPEILVAKGNGSVTTPSISLTGSTSPYTLTYKCNNGKIVASSTTANVVVGEAEVVSGTTYACTVSIPNQTENIVLVFTNTDASNNTRLDDMELIGTNAATISTTPTISPADGSVFSTATQEISITAAQGASIYYTTDGTTPDNTKTSYSSAFTISETKTIKAIAYETGKQPSSVASATITKIDLFNITCSAPEGGTYTVQVGNEAAQTITEATVIQGGEGKTIIMTIAASAGYKPQATPFVVKDADDAPVSVSKDGNNYSFTMPSKAVTITAKYSKLYSIANSVTGNGSIAIKDKDGNVITETSSGSKVVVDVNPETGYQLTELYYIKQDESEHNAITATENVYSFNMGEKNVTVYATFSAKVLNITYKDQNNADFSGVHGDNYPTTHTYGTETQLVSPTKEHYAFEGWFGNSECTGDAVTSIPGTAYTVDFTLYAKWEINKHSVTYVLGDDASGCTNLENQPYGTEITVCTSQQKPHHNFNGWTVTEGGITIENGKFNMPDNDVTLTANWTAHKKYTITFKDDVHETDCSKYEMKDAWAGTQIVFPALDDNTAVAPTGDCVADHYHFYGWILDGTTPTMDPDNVIKAGDTSKTASATVTYKAVWVKETNE